VSGDFHPDLIKFDMNLVRGMAHVLAKSGFENVPRAQFPDCNQGQTATDI
jgi:hypothetical protein